MPSFEKRTTENISEDIDEFLRPGGVEIRLKELKGNKAIGYDGVSPNVLKECASALALPLYEIFKNSINSSELPIECKLANVTQLFKKGNLA